VRKVGVIGPKIQYQKINFFHSIQKLDLKFTEKSGTLPNNIRDEIASIMSGLFGKSNCVLPPHLNRLSDNSISR